MVINSCSERIAYPSPFTKNVQVQSLGVFLYYEQKKWTKLQFFYLKFLIFSATKRLRTRINKGIFKSRSYRDSLQAEENNGEVEHEIMVNQSCLNLFMCLF